MWTALLYVFIGIAIIGGAILFFLINERANREKDMLQDKISGLTLEKQALNERLIVLTSQRSSLDARLNILNESNQTMREQLEKSFAEQQEQREKSFAEQLEQREKSFAEQKEQLLQEARKREEILVEEARKREEQMTKAAHDQEERMAKMMLEQKEQMRDTFKSLSAETSAAFGEQSAARISEILKPMQEKFEIFDKSVKESQMQNVEQSASMKTLIEQVMQQSQTIGDEAKALTNALTGYSKVQGDFGEMLLTDLLKSSGLEEGVQFNTQSVITDEMGHEIKSDTGATMIPDVIVYYPDETIVIIDSKTSLTAYNQYMNTDDAEERKKFAREHVISVRSHVDELKKKDYASYIPQGKTKVNYNIMFIPMEGAFRLMLEEDPLLWQAAKANNVLIVSQMTLTIVLNMIQMSWKQYNQEKNIAEVYKTAEELMSQLKNWMDSYVEVGKNLEKARKAYDDSKQKLIESNQSVVKKIGKLERLGLTAKRPGGKLKTGGRMVTSHESIIPAEFTDNTNTEQ